MAKDRFGYGEDTSTSWSNSIAGGVGGGLGALALGMSVPASLGMGAFVTGLSRLMPSNKSIKDSFGYGEGDMGYSMHALNLAKEKNIINKHMKPETVREIMVEQGMDSYGFIVDEYMLEEIFKNG
tara:strand:+ start:12027 stop:12401 length:375 start_codon:yes stop_codon:yes gene_type:complete